MKSIKVSNKVYSKDFQIKSLGYDCREVDSFLDEVNENIVKLEREIESLKDQIRTLEGQKSAVEQQYKNVSMELYNAKAQNGVALTSNANFSNMELFNRISSLEGMVKKLLEKENSK
jgi:DivIVA domain-containing protein